jgi:hypothetical protein
MQNIQANNEPAKISKGMRAVMLFVSLIILATRCSQPDTTQSVGEKPSIPGDSVVALVEQAYIFGYPLMMMDATMRISTNFPEVVPNKPLATVIHFEYFLTILNHHHSGSLI